MSDGLTILKLLVTCFAVISTLLGGGQGLGGMGIGINIRHWVPVG